MIDNYEIFVLKKQWLYSVKKNRIILKLNKKNEKEKLLTTDYIDKIE